MDFSFAYTAGEDQVTRARDVFLTVAHEYAAEKERTIIEPPRVELNMYQVRNEIDGTNTTRVSKRIHWKMDPAGAAQVLARKTERISKWEARRKRLDDSIDHFD